MLNLICVGDGKIVLKEDERNDYHVNSSFNGVETKKSKQRDPVDIELDVVLGKMPRKVGELVGMPIFKIYQFDGSV